MLGAGPFTAEPLISHRQEGSDRLGQKGLLEEVTLAKFRARGVRSLTSAAAARRTVGSVCVRLSVLGLPQQADEPQ